MKAKKYNGHTIEEMIEYIDNSEKNLSDKKNRSYFSQVKTEPHLKMAKAIKSVLQELQNTN